MSPATRERVSPVEIYAFTWSSSSSSPYMELPMNHTHTRCCSRGITCLWVCFCTQISSVSRKPDKGWTTARHGLSSVISIHIYIVEETSDTYIVLGCSCCSAVSSSASFVVCSVDKLDLSLFSFVLQLAKFVCINKVHCTDVCKSLNTPGHVTATYL